MSSLADKWRWGLALLLVPVATLLVFIVLVSLSAKGLYGGEENNGRITLSDVTLQQIDGQLYLDAQALIELPDTIRAGLDSGVPLEFILTLRFLNPRPYWFDETLVQVEQRFSLNYYELTRHYRVQALQTDTSNNYRSLSSALRGLGEFNRLPLITGSSAAYIVDENLVFDEGPTEVLGSLDFRLDAQSLPLPLQPLIISSWRLASEEFQWSVN